jgi:hypothetical protein
MPTYLITHTKGQQGDIAIDGDDLRLELDPGWARFYDDTGLCLAIPTGQVSTIQRIDGPAPEG